MEDLITMHWLSQFPSVAHTDWREREPGLSGLWGLTVSWLGWTWTNTEDSSSEVGSTFTWRAHVLLWAAGMYCSSSFSDFRVTTYSFRLQFFSSSCWSPVSTWRVSIWSSPPPPSSCLPCQAWRCYLCWLWSEKYNNYVCLQWKSLQFCSWDPIFISKLYLFR